MARIRNIYNNLGLFVGQSGAQLTDPTAHSGAANIKQLQRLQDISWNFDIPLQDVSQLGSLAPIDRVNTEGATVGFNFSYYTVDLQNEQFLGFRVADGVSCITDILTKAKDEKNYYLVIAPEGTDLNTFGDLSTKTNIATVGFGNGFITSYSHTAAVGGFPTSSIGAEALNIRGYQGGTGKIPAVNKSGLYIDGNFFLPSASTGDVGKLTVLQPGDITIDIDNNAGLFQDMTGVCVQSYTVSFDLARNPIRCLGSRLPVAREIQFPIQVTFSMDVLTSDYVSASLSQYICSGNEHNIAVNLREPKCDGTLGNRYARFKIANARLTSQNVSTSIGPEETMTFNWVGQIGASGDNTNGVFFSGVTGYSAGVGLVSP